MGVIINPRGPGGSGKTELVRRVLARYGWTNGRPGPQVAAIRRDGRALPIGYRLRHPDGGGHLTVLGHYERTCGGCDTFRLEDGGLEQVFDAARRHAGEGDDVLLEGRELSLEHERSAWLAGLHPLHVLHLTTPAELCAKNLVARRRLRRAEWLRAHAAVVLEQARVSAACEKLSGVAALHVLDFDEALARIETLLRLRRPGFTAPAAAARAPGR